MESIIVSIITSGATVLGVIITNVGLHKNTLHKLETAQAITDTKIQELTEEVRKHNTFGDRITRLEMEIAALKEKRRQSL